MGHYRTNKLECEKWFTMWKMAYSLKNGQHCEKWVTVLKMGHTFKNEPECKKKMGHNVTNACVKNWVTV